MSYQHGLTMTATLKKGITKARLVEVFQELFAYFGARTPEEWTTDCGCSFHYSRAARTCDLRASGCVEADFLGVISRTADRLGPLTEQPGRFVLDDYDTPDMGEARKTVVFGPSREACLAARFTWLQEDIQRMIDAVQTDLSPFQRFQCENLKEDVADAIRRTQERLAALEGLQEDGEGVRTIRS